MDLDSLTILLHRAEGESAVVWERERLSSEVAAFRVIRKLITFPR